MGNSNKKPQDYDVVRSFKQDQWVNLEKRPNYQIWENKINHKKADVYPLNKQLKPLDLDHYEMRYNNSNDIVKVHNLEIQEDSTLCSRSSKSNILVQRIPYRLNDVAELTQPEALSVLRSAYSGFNTLSTFYGPVEPYQDLICFNEDGKTKVWVNSNLSQNKISSQRLDNPIGSFANLNTVYVNKLFDMVENKTQGGAFPPTLKNKFRQFSPKTYFEALNLIQEYASEERIQIPPTISPRTSSNFSNGNFILQNSSSQVNSYNSVSGSQGPKWNQSAAQQAPLTLNPNSGQLAANTSNPQLQNSFNRNTYQSNPQSQYYNNYPVNSQSSSKLGSALPNGQFSIVIPPMRPVANINPNLNNSFSNSSLMIKPKTPGLQFDSPSKIVSMQAINKTVGDGNTNNTLIENRTKSPIGSIANISQIKLTDRQPIDQNVLQNQNQSSFKQQIPVISSTGQQTKYLNQPQINQGGYAQPGQQFLQRPHYTVVSSHSQPTYLTLNPGRQNIGYSGYVQPQFSPRVMNRPQIIFNNQQPIVRAAQNPVQPPQAQVQAQAQLQLQPQAQPQTQIQVQPKIQSQAQGQQAQVSGPSSERDRQIQQKMDIKNQLVQNIQSRQLSHQSGSVSQPRSSENRGESEPEQRNYNYLSNNEQNLANAYDEQNQEDNYGADQQEQQDEEDLYNQQGEQQQTYRRQQGFVEGEVDQVQRQLEKLQQQKNYDHSKEAEHDQYFPFANNKGDKGEQIKRIATMQIRQEEINQVHQLEKNKQQLSNNEAYKINSSSQQQAQKLQKSTQNKTKKVQIQQPETQIKQQKPVSKQSSPLVVKLETEKSSQSPESGKIEQKKNRVESNSNQKQTVTVSANQYQYQYKSSVPQSSENERIPQNARYEDIEEYIRNKYKTYIGVQSQSSDYRPSSSVSPYQNDLGKIGEVQMASYVQSKYNQFSSSSNQEINFSFRPSTFQNGQSYANSNYGQKPGMISSYEYMRVQQMIGDPQQEKQPERKSSMLSDNKKSEKNGNQQDILDVKNMERSLDKKYSAMKSNQLMSIDMNKKDYNQQNQFDVKKLQENLIRFQQSRVGSGQTNQLSSSPVNQPRFQTSQVSKIQSIDEILANRRRSSMNRGLDYNKDYKDTVKSYTYENQSPGNQFGRRSRASKVSKQISDIDQKFNKYVKGGAALNASSSSKLINQPKSKQYNYDYRQRDQQEVSRNATGYFGDVDNNSKGWEDRKNYQTTKYKSSKLNQVTSISGTSKGPSYEDLRKFMWS